MTVEAFNVDHRVALSLVSTGEEIDTWDEYAVTLDMLQPGAAYTFAMWYSETRRTTWDLLRRRAKAGDGLVLSIDGAPQLNGRIETIDTEADGHGERHMVLSGRDLAGPALDFDADPTISISGMRLEDALRRVFASVDLPVQITTADAAREVTTHRSGGARAAAVEAVASSPPPTSSTMALPPTITGLPFATAFAAAIGVSISPISTVAISQARQRARARARAVKSLLVDEAQPKPSERVWAFAESIVSRLGALLWVAPSASGGLTIVADRPDDAAPPTFAFGRRILPDGTADPRSNILSGGERISLRGVPTSVSVYTHTRRGDHVSERGRSTTVNVAITDPAVTRGFVIDPPPPQPRHIRSARARTAQRAAQEGSRVILDAMRGFRTYRCTVRGHGQRVDGRDLLYAVNTVALVYDDVCTDAEGRPLAEEMLIVRVEFRRSRSKGTTTTLTLVPKGSLAIEPTGL